MSTADERSQLDVLRAELNGKLDVLIERVGNISTLLKNHELRIQSLEERGSSQAQAAIRELADHEARIRKNEAYALGEDIAPWANEYLERFRSVEKTVARLSTRFAVAMGIITFVSAIGGWVVPTVIRHMLGY